MYLQANYKIFIVYFFGKHFLGKLYNLGVCFLCLVMCTGTLQRAQVFKLGRTWRQWFRRSQ